jgi:hypothetical protein
MIAAIIEAETRSSNRSLISRMSSQFTEGDSHRTIDAAWA